MIDDVIDTALGNLCRRRQSISLYVIYYYTIKLDVSK